MRCALWGLCGLGHCDGLLLLQDLLQRRARRRRRGGRRRRRPGSHGCGRRGQLVREAVGLRGRPTGLHDSVATLSDHPPPQPKRTRRRRRQRRGPSAPAHRLAPRRFRLARGGRPGGGGGGLLLLRRLLALLDVVEERCGGRNRRLLLCKGRMQLAKGGQLSGGCCDAVGSRVGWLGVC